MAIVPIQFRPEGVVYLSGTAFPEYRIIPGTNFPISTLGFDAAATETGFWQFRATRYGSGNLTLDFDWYADTAASGDVVFGAAIAAITPNIDTQDVTTKAFAAESTFIDNHLGTVNRRKHRATITISNLDGLAEGDIVWLRFRRLGADAADNMAGDALVSLITLSYSDT